MRDDRVASQARCASPVCRGLEHSGQGDGSRLARLQVPFDPGRADSTVGGFRSCLRQAAGRDDSDVAALERHGRLQLGPSERILVLSISAATIDRLLGDVKIAAAGGRRRRTGSTPRSVDWSDWSLRLANVCCWWCSSRLALFQGPALELAAEATSSHILNNQCGLVSDSLACREFKPLFRMEARSACAAHLSMDACAVDAKARGS